MDSKNVWEEISDGNDVLYLGKREVNSRAYISKAIFWRDPPSGSFPRIRYATVD